MARKAKSFIAHEPGPKKRTSIGQSVRSRPKNKNKRRNFKRYRGQGKWLLKNSLNYLRKKKKKLKRKKR